MKHGYFLPVVPLRAALGAADSPAEHAYFTLAEQFLLPLLRMLERLEDDGAGYGLTLALPPALLSWFENVSAASRLSERLRVRIAVAEKALVGRKSTPDKTLRNPEPDAAEAWLEGCRDRYFWFERNYSRQLGKAFQRLASFGNLELITTTATHCALPLLRAEETALRAQIAAATDDYCVSFGVHPQGIWLPECAYFPGLERYLEAAGLQYCFARPEAFRAAQDPLAAGLRRPVLAGDRLAAFAPDETLTAQIASDKMGYYLDGEYLRPDLAFARGAEWKNRQDKEWQPGTARRKADSHATHYLALLQTELDKTPPVAIGPSGGVPAPADPALVAAVDGTFWSGMWQEGPEFLNLLFRKAFYDQKAIEISTPGRYLTNSGLLQKTVPGEGATDGSGLFAGFYEQGADALLPELQLAAAAMKKATGHGRVLRQMGREMLLAQEWRSEDPQGSLQEAKRHLARFCALEQVRQKEPEDTELLMALEADTPVFVYLDVAHFQTTPASTGS